MRRAFILIFGGSVVCVFVQLGSFVFQSQAPCPWRMKETAENFPPQPLLNTSHLAYAIPTFSRKYKVSCTTCHTAFPQLNSFGMGFKRNGYMFPNEGSDAGNAVIQEERVALGSEEDKKAWPKKSTWPSSIPANLPVSAVLTGTFQSQPRSSNANEKLSFDGLGGQAALVAGGSIGRLFPFWGELAFNRSVSTSTTDNTSTVMNEVEVERVFVGIKPWVNPYLLIKVGRFEPGLLAVSNHRSLLGGYYFTGDRRVGTNRWTLESAQNGIEASGVFLKDKFAYTFGVVEGATGSTTIIGGTIVGNQNNNEKDFYGRIEYKLLGSLWENNTLTFGTFVYQGFSKLVSATTNQNDHFTLVGGDLSAVYKKFYSVVSVTHQENTKPVLGSTTSRATHAVLGEVTWIPLPWFLPAARYDFFDSGPQEDHRITTALNFLLVPNVKTFVRLSLDKPDGTDFFDQPSVVTGLTAAF